MIEDAWARIKQAKAAAGAIRVDESHPADFFATQDDQGRPGMVLILKTQPMAVPRLEELEIASSVRPDGRWSLALWLEGSYLLSPFAQLCDDLVEASRDVAEADLARFVVVRLQRWSELLAAARGGMSLSKLRGIIAEMLVLELAMTKFGRHEAILGWRGPFRSPQDFALPGYYLEVKATFPTAKTVRITSEEQLAAPGELFLVVATLTTLLSADPGLTLAGLARRLEASVREPDSGELALELHRRLRALGVNLKAEYSARPFRLDGIRYYSVSGSFPRITPDVLPSGIGQVAYDLDLAALPAFVVESPFGA
jgi:hypothetical protein